MYLEIGPRQSGKTQRLINQIYRDKNSYQIQILMGINYNSLHLIKKQIKGNAKVKICLSFESLRILIAENLDKLHKIKLYVDEFMYSNTFCNNFENIFDKYFDLIKNGYFSSSINSNNMKVLNTLQNENENESILITKTKNRWL